MVYQCFYSISFSILNTKDRAQIYDKLKNDNIKNQ